MGTDDVKRLKQLEQENNRLKKILAERDLEIEVMKEIAVKKWWAYSCVLSRPDMPWAEE
jgi:putative transposase